MKRIGDLRPDMRLKKNSSNYHASSLKVKDARNDKSFDGATGGAKKKKNTKKWCLGIEGRHHVPIWTEAVKLRGCSGILRTRPPIMQVSCENCDKVFETDFGFWGRPKLGRDVLLEKWRKKLGIDKDK